MIAIYSFTCDDRRQTWRPSPVIKSSSNSHQPDMSQSVAAAAPGAVHGRAEPMAPLNDEPAAGSRLRSAEVGP
jgi:hypothetical protein